MDRSLFDLLDARGASRCVFWSDPASGLRAILAMDDLSLGFAAGGTRTKAYPSFEAAVEDAIALAKAMSIKLALGGLAVAGGKLVVIDHPGLNRPAAFAKLGEFIEEMGGVFRTAGDMGTTREDLETMARHCQYVTTYADLSATTARTVILSMEACAEAAGKPGLAGLRIAVQGAGAIGAAVARAAIQAGAEVMITDVDAGQARVVAEETGARVVDADTILEQDCDILAPCAIGGVITTKTAERVRAWAVCGAANNMMADAAAEQRIVDRKILYVPTEVASAGAVIYGVSRADLFIINNDSLVDGIAKVARAVLEESRRSGKLPTEVALAYARAELESKRVPHRPVP